MNWERIAQIVQDALAFFLIGRLLVLRLHRVYGVFCVFLLADVSGSLFWFLWSGSERVRVYIDYRAGWFAGKMAVWVLTIWTVYALLAAILMNFQGIYRLSRRVLNVSFALAIAIGLLSAVPESWATGLAGPRFANPLDRLVEAALIFDRVLASAALLVLLVILVLLLWFPVDISRNLAVFCTGFVIYFGAKAALLLERGFWLHHSTVAISVGITFVMSLCISYWAIFLSKAGERVNVRPGHAWQPAQQERLIGQLEQLNAALLRASQRKRELHNAIS